MLIALSIVSLVLVVVSFKFMNLKIERNYLDNAACIEHTRAQIATELLFEGTAKHQELSFEDTCRLIESIRQEPSPMARKVLGDKIIGIKEPQAKNHIGF